MYLILYIIPLLPCLQLYGKEVDGSHRPSSKSTEFDDFSVDCDKKNRDILKAVKARDAIKCVECGKPRVVYSASKMTREQVCLLWNCLSTFKIF